MRSGTHDNSTRRGNGRRAGTSSWASRGHFVSPPTQAVSMERDLGHACQWCYPRGCAPGPVYVEELLVGGDVRPALNSKPKISFQRGYAAPPPSMRSSSVYLDAHRSVITCAQGENIGGGETAAPKQAVSVWTQNTKLGGNGTRLASDCSEHPSCSCSCDCGGPPAPSRQLCSTLLDHSQALL